MLARGVGIFGKWGRADKKNLVVLAVLHDRGDHADVVRRDVSPPAEQNFKEGRQCFSNLCLYQRAQLRDVQHDAVAANKVVLGCRSSEGVVHL